MLGKYNEILFPKTLLYLTTCLCQHLYAAPDSTNPVLLPVIKIEATRSDLTGCKHLLQYIESNKISIRITWV